MSPTIDETEYNRISGSLPSEMGLLTEMRYFEVLLFLRYFFFEIFKTINSHFRMKNNSLQIQNNNIVGTIPSELGNWNKVSVVGPNMFKPTTILVDAKNHCGMFCNVSRY